MPKASKIALKNVLAAIARQKDAKKKRTCKQDKFENLTSAGKKRRRCRDTIRLLREKKQTTAKKAKKTAMKATKTAMKSLKRKGSNSESSSRHVPAHCCGRRVQDCSCFRSGRGLEIVHGFQKAKFAKLPSMVRKSDVQTWRDTADMPLYHEQIDHAMPYPLLFPYAFTWRHFSNSFFWEGLQATGAVAADRPPDWKRFQWVMEKHVEEKESYFGGLFYSGNVLTHYRYSCTGEWQDCEELRIDRIGRQILALKVVWHCARVMKSSFEQLQRCPTRDLWQVCTRDFLGAVSARTSGMFDHYSVKKMIDAVLISQPCLEKVLSWFPMSCPAYKNELPKLYLGIRGEEDLWLAANHYHRLLKGCFPRFTLKESLAQLCWIERQVTR